MEALPVIGLFVKAVVAGPAIVAGIVGAETVGPVGLIMVSKVRVAVAGKGPFIGQLKGGEVDKSSQIILATPLKVTEGKKYWNPTRTGVMWDEGTRAGLKPGNVIGTVLVLVPEVEKG